MATVSPLEDRMVSRYWLMKNVFGFTDKEIEYESRQTTMPLEMAAKIAKIALQVAIEAHDKGSHPS